MRCPNSLSLALALVRDEKVGRILLLRLTGGFRLKQQEGKEAKKQTGDGGIGKVHMGIGPGEPSFVVAPCSVLLGEKGEKEIENVKKEPEIERGPMNSTGQRNPVTQSTAPLNASRFAPKRQK